MKTYEVEFFKGWFPKAYFDAYADAFAYLYYCAQELNDDLIPADSLTWSGVHKYGCDRWALKSSERYALCRTKVFADIYEVTEEQALQEPPTPLTT